MSAIEEVQAAHAKLTKLRNESTPGPWTNTYSDLDGADLAPVCDMVVQCGSYCQGGTAPGLSDTDADLIVTLHRTIDFQLGLLNRLMEMNLGPVLDDLTGGFFGRTVDLARAINGVDS